MVKDQQGTVRWSDAERVRTLQICNPTRRNAMDDGVRVALAAALRKAMDDPACRAIIVVGEGATFCSGGDLASMPTTDVKAIQHRMGEVRDIVTTILTGPKPVVAAVEGFAYGSGMGLAAACDFVVASREAQFCASFRRVGLAPDAALGWTLPRRVGSSRAREIVLFADPVPATRAADIGLVDELVDAGTALSRAFQRGVELAAAAPLAMASAKDLLNHSSDDLVSFCDTELSAQTALFASADFTEGREAFFARRPATFVGR